MRRLPFFALLLVLAGCGTPPAPRPAPPTAPVSAGFPFAVTDALGRTVTVSRRPERIISLAPAVTETLFAVGAGPRVVAVTTEDSYPPDVKTLPSVGGFGPNALSTEAILAQRPDLVFCVGEYHRPVAESLEKLGIPVVAVEPTTLDAVAGSIETVGWAVGCEPGAAAIAADFRRRRAAVRDRTAAVPADRRPKVLYVLWDDPLQTAGPGTFLGQMIADAGGANVVADVAQQYPRLSDEAVLSRDPDLVIAPDGGAAGLPDRLRARAGWAGLTAVRRGRVLTLPEDLTVRAGPRLIDGLEAMEKLVRGATTVR